MQHNYWIYLFIMFGVTYLTRVLPLLIFKQRIRNRFMRSFLAYIPYAVLAAMTFPAVFFAVDCLPAAAAGVLAASDCSAHGEKFVYGGYFCKCSCVYYVTAFLKKFYIKYTNVYYYLFL